MSFIHNSNEEVLRSQLVALLKGGQAHASLADAVANFPIERAGEQPAGLPYSAWQILEHIRITLQDLLQFCTNAKYVELEWPAAYWPKQPTPPDSGSWNATVKAIHADLKSFEDLIQSPESNLHSTIPWGKNKETLLREALLAADHTSYHVGELIVVRRLMGAWKK